MRVQSHAILAIQIGVAFFCAWLPRVGQAQEPAVLEVRDAMRRAAGYYVARVASHGGYVYHYSEDLKSRWGEGAATPDQIWVQPPGTPTVGLALVHAYEATGDEFYLQAATEAAEALIYGQLKSGGWTNCIDFNPRGARVADYRVGKGRGKNNSSLDDGQTQTAIRFLMHLDRATQFSNKNVHEAVQLALNALLAAQFDNGAFPQVWTGPVSGHPQIKASFPDYDWRTEHRIKEYWTLSTLNDNVAGYVAETLIDAVKIYEDERYLQSLNRLADFLSDAQLPLPQPGWAQQYTDQMHPAWARKFEPPALASDETQEAISTLLSIYQLTHDPDVLKPIPTALEWLRRSLLPDGRLSRFYELQTNRPLYMQGQGELYTMTYDDDQLPSHYSWKIASRIEQLQRAYDQALNSIPESRNQVSARKVREILESLDDQGRWVLEYQGEKLVGQPKFQNGERYLSSQQFSRNLTALADYLRNKS